MNKYKFISWNNNDIQSIIKAERAKDRMERSGAELVRQGTNFCEYKYWVAL